MYLQRVCKQYVGHVTYTLTDGNNMNELNKLWLSVLSYAGGNGWVVKVFLIVLGVALVNFFVRRSLKKLRIKLLTTKNPWDESLVESIGQPFRLLIWVVGITFAAEIIQSETKTFSVEFLGTLRDVGVIFAIAWFAVRFIKRAETNIVSAKKDKKEGLDPTTIYAVAKLVRLTVLITTALIILQTMGFSVSGVLAFGGIGGIAIGFAAKDLLANFFGGFMIYMDRPFSVGDWIRSPDRKIEGTVEQIGWRLTCIRTFDKRPLYVPNSMFASIAVENPSRMNNRRIYETIGLRYEDAGLMRKIISDVQQMLREHPEIDSNQTLIVNFTTFAASSMDFFIYTFTRTTDWVKFHEIKQDVLLKILDIIDGHGAEVAFPTSTLHVPEAVKLEQYTNEH